MGKFLKRSEIFRRWPSTCSAFLLGLAIVLFSAGIVRAQTIPITGVLHRVTEPNGDLKTYIEVIIGDEFGGTLPDVSPTSLFGIPMVLNIIANTPSLLIKLDLLSPVARFLYQLGPRAGIRTSIPSRLSAAL